jgi:hypothetical protein
MKYILPVLLIILLASGCSKTPSCVQCAKEVASTTQASTVTTDYQIVYIQLCGRQADTALNYYADIYPAFAKEYGIIPYTCAYKY